jgi:hypothetical protein
MSGKVEDSPGSDVEENYIFWDVTLPRLLEVLIFPVHVSWFRLQSTPLFVPFYLCLADTVYCLPGLLFSHEEGGCVPVKSL